MGFAQQQCRLGVCAVDLSQDDAFQFDRLAHSLLDEALFEYDQFVTVDRRRVNLAQWKQWKHDDDVVVYRERHVGDAAHETLLELHGEPSGRPTTTRFTAFAPTDPSRPSKSKSKSSKVSATPRLLAAGSLSSSLDDILYGLVTPTAAAMRLKAAHSQHDDFLDGAVLASLRSPTPHEPFQFLGIKWLLQRGHGGGLVRPRDFVFLESSGVQVRQDGSGQRVGFHIMHSVDVPQCSPEGRGGSVQRGAFSACSLYHELSHGVVDVYMTALVQPRGHLIAPLAVRSAAAMLTSNWRALTLFAENKKLAWMLETHRQLLGAPAPGSAPPSSSRCGLCSKSFRGFNKTAKHKHCVACQLCSMAVCAQCSVVRTLRTEGFVRHSVVATEMLFCKKCIALAGEENAGEIARQQLWESELVRTGRAHTQTALALVRRDTSANGSQLLQQHQRYNATSLSTERGLQSSLSLTAYRSNHHHDHESHRNLRATWQDTDPGSQRYHIYDDKTRAAAPQHGSASSVDDGGVGQPRGRAASTSGQRRATNGTWTGSARTTDALSIAALDYRSSSFQDPAGAPLPHQDSNEPVTDAGGRGSTASSALVLLDDRKSSRRLKALDYLPSATESGPETSAAETSATERSSVVLFDNQSERASMNSSSVYTEVEVESVSSRSSFSSSIAVLDVDAGRADAPASRAMPTTIDEEDDLPRSDLEMFYHQQLKLQQEQLHQQQQQTARQHLQSPPVSSRSSMIPLHSQYPPSHQQPYQQQYPRSHQLQQPQQPSRVHFQDTQSQASSDAFGDVRSSELLPRPSGSELSRRSTSTMVSAQEPSGGGEQRLSYQMQLWLQMNELRDTAESTYQITQRNSAAIASQHPKMFRDMRFFSQQPLGGPPPPRRTVGSMRMAPASASAGDAPRGYPQYSRSQRSSVPMSN